MSPKELEQYGALIFNIVGDSSKIYAPSSPKTVLNYYKKLAWLYRLFHSKDGAMHLPLKFSEDTSHHEKLLAQAKTIQTLIRTNNYKNILELGCGMGHNLNFLSRENPDIYFTGLDISKSNLDIAHRNNSVSDRLRFQLGSYQDLMNINQKYDLIFAIETLCYADNLVELLNGLSDNLTENGSILIFDVFVKNSSKPLVDPHEARAYHLLNWGFALNHFHSLDSVRPSDHLKNLSLEECVDLRDNILSNLKTFQKGACRAFQFPICLKLLYRMRVIPLEAIKHLAAGLFAFYFIQTRYIGYLMLRFRKASCTAEENLLHN